MAEDLAFLKAIGSSLLLIGAILILVSIALPWWSSTLTSEYASSPQIAATVVTTDFYPGSSYTVLCLLGCSPISSTQTYGSYFPNVGHIYGDVYWLLIGAGVVALAGASLGFMRVFAKFGRRHLIVTCAVAIASIVMAVAIPCWTAFAQPGTFNQDAASNSALCWSGSSPCNSFFGGGVSQGPPFSTTYTWGPGAGWYLDIIGAVLATIGVIVLFIIYRGTYSSPNELPPSDAMEGEPHPGVEAP